MISKTKPSTIDEFLGRLDPKKRAALEKLRKMILAAAPGAEECINYGVPAVRLHGKMLVAFSAGAKHCSFYPGAHPLAVHRAELATYETSKGTLRFQPEAPPTANLVRKLVKTRLAQHRSLQKKSGRRPAP